jgi:hypothetical protein
MAKRASKKTPPHFWNHRVVRHRVQRSESLSGFSLAIHEAHYESKKSKTKPGSITESPVGVWGENKTELRATLKRMLKALDKPILKYDDF